MLVSITAMYTSCLHACLCCYASKSRSESWGMFSEKWRKCCRSRMWHSIKDVNRHLNNSRGRRNTSRHNGQQHHARDASIRIYPHDSFHTKNKIDKNTNSHWRNIKFLLWNETTTSRVGINTRKFTDSTGKWAIQYYCSKQAEYKRKLKFTSQAVPVHNCLRYMYSFYYYIHRNLVITPIVLMWNLFQFRINNLLFCFKQQRASLVCH